MRRSRPSYPQPARVLPAQGSSQSRNCPQPASRTSRVPSRSSDSVASTSDNRVAPASREELRLAIRDVPGFPKPGITFKDITPLLADGRLFRQACEYMAAPFRGTGIGLVAAIESRGFLLGGPIAQALGVGIVPIRKVGKLPYTTQRVTYALEYGTDALEVHVDACIGHGNQVLVVDDVLATGGTAAAACELIESVGGEVVGCSFLIALEFLGGAGRLSQRRIESVLSY